MSDKHKGEAAPDGGPATPPTGRAGPIDLAAIRQLLDLMGEHDLVEVEIEQGDLAVRLRKAGAGQPVVTASPMPMAVPAAAPAAAPVPAAKPVDEGLVFIRSPMVGTFYSAASPEADPFVKVGDHVSEDSVVCIVEAMKVFNEIRAEVTGTIERVLAKNAEAVEFGQPMFAVRQD
jgi:acetyl-CoA carboxylase biotin carboxyl carrier protein